MGLRNVLGRFVAPCTLTLLGDGRAKVVFDRPERAPAAGQTAAFYDGEVVLGGGFIDSEMKNED